MDPLPLYILAGGESRRFGADKARAQLDSQPLIRRITDVLRPLAAYTTAVSDRPDKYADLGIHTITDHVPHLGPLGGLVTAMTDRQQRIGHGWLILCSCDLLRVEPGWIRCLSDARSAEHRCLVFATPHVQPMPGLYHTHLLPLARHQLEAFDGSLRALLNHPEARPHRLPPPADWPQRLQANRPEELTEHRRAHPANNPQARPGDEG